MDGITEVSRECDKMRRRCSRASEWAKKKATIIKVVCIFTNVLVILLGLAVGVLGVAAHPGASNSAGDRAYLDVITALGFAISGLKAALAASGLERRAVRNKELAIKLGRMARSLSSLQRLSDTDAKRARLELIMEEYEHLELETFTEQLEGPSTYQSQPMIAPIV